ncbi:MAG: IS4 family transposase, partial [Acidobacteriota bacterium]
TTLAVTTEGLPLGLLTQKVLARGKKRDCKNNKHKKVSIKEKESGKWLDALEQTMASLPKGVQVVTVGDRDADVFEFLIRAEQLGADYLIRARSNRALMAGERCLWEELATAPVSGRLEVEVAAKKDEPARTAKVSVRYAKVELRPPQRPKEIRIERWKPITLWAIYVKEIYATESVTPLDWMLLTNLPVNNFDDALERIQWYCKRWSIELWHKVLKSGCRVEDCLLETAERIKRYLALMR